MRAIPCEAVSYLSTLSDGPSLNFEVTETALSGSSYELFWLDRSGSEQKYADLGNNRRRLQQTYVGHPWVIRVSTPQPEVNLVSNCTGIETKRAFTFRLELMHGWNVHLECVIEFERELMSKIVHELNADLQYLTTLLPTEILTRLHATQIFVVGSTQAKPTPQMRQGGGAVFMNPLGSMARQKAPELYSGAVVINADKWQDLQKYQPAVTLHELAHAWHCMNWNPCFDGATQIRSAYDAAMTSGIYDMVERNDGTQGKAYAATNDHEYFAELTEAWFWENDYYPYNREQLLVHDPLGAAVVEAAWTVNG